MGGTSSQNTATNQNTTQNQTENNSLIGGGTTAQSASTGPWAQSMPFLSGMLGQLQGQLQGQMGGTGVTSGENSALDTMVRNGQTASGQFGPQVGGVASGLMAGGGAQSTDPMLLQAYQDYQRRLSPTANGSMIGANSGLKPYLDTLSSDITNQVNGSFAAAGRDFSGANQGALGRGIAQGLSPVIASQYNTDTSNMLGAAGNLYGAGNTTAGALAGNNQAANANRVTGAGMIPAVNDVNNMGANAELQAEAARRGIPAQALGLLAQIGVPIAGLGNTSTQSGTTTQNQSGTGTSSGTGTMNGTSNTQNRMSGAQQFATIAQGIGSMIPRGPMTFNF